MGHRCIDEAGYQQLDKTQAGLFFDLIKSNDIKNDAQCAYFCSDIFFYKTVRQKVIIYLSAKGPLYVSTIILSIPDDSLNKNYHMLLNTVHNRIHPIKGFGYIMAEMITQPR